MHLDLHLDLHLEQLTSLESGLCQRINRWNGQRFIGHVFAAISRLGDGIAWYALMGVLALYGDWPLALVMALTGAAATMIYRWIKARTRRPRPCEAHAMPHLTVAPLDRFSFPSGHTLHAVCFTILACHGHPALGWLLVPFSTLVALSRLVLGLHYPSDVLSGASLGAILAVTAIALMR